MPVPLVTDEQVRDIISSTALRFRDRIDMFFKETVREKRRDGEAPSTFADLARQMNDEAFRLLAAFPPALDESLHALCKEFEEIINSLTDVVSHELPQACDAATEASVMSFLDAIGTKALELRAGIQKFLGKLTVKSGVSPPLPPSIKKAGQPAS